MLKKIGDTVQITYAIKFNHLVLKEIKILITSKRKKFYISAWEIQPADTKEWLFTAYQKSKVGCIQYSLGRIKTKQQLSFGLSQMNQKHYFPLWKKEYLYW